MEYLFLLAAAAAAVHSVSFALWLRRGGNRSGSLWVLLLTLLSLALPLYRIITAL